MESEVCKPATCGGDIEAEGGATINSEHVQRATIGSVKDEIPAMIKQSTIQCGRYSYDISKIDIRAYPGGQNGNLVIGSFCSIADRVTIFLGGNHHKNWISQYPFGMKVFGVDWGIGNSMETASTTKGDVVIGSDVWIGSGATIMSGVTIGHGAVVGAMAVVAHSIPPYVIVAGNPARTIGYRFETNEIAVLLSMKWWDWSDDKIKEGMYAICGMSVAVMSDFSRKYDAKT